MMLYRIRQLGKRVGKQAAIARGMMHIDSHDLSGTVLLTGSGRSGTTWMSQIINHGNPYRDIFEPFHPHHVECVKGWPKLRYVPASSNGIEWSAQIERLLAGRVRSRWTDAYNRKHFAQQRLVKATRTNLMLGHIRQRFAQVKLIFAMRHPCAVVHSRIKLGWEAHLDQMLGQPMLMRDYLEPHRETIERADRADDPWHKHFVMWCIENMVPLREIGPGDAHLLRYEDLCQDFDREVAALFAYLGRPVPADVKATAQRRSAHYRRDSAILRGGDLTGDWQRHVQPPHIDTMLATLAAFGLSPLYGQAPAPRCDRDAVFIGTSPTGRVRSHRKDAA